MAGTPYIYTKNKRTITQTAAVSGVATVDLSTNLGSTVQITIAPSGSPLPTGTGTLTALPINSSTYEAVYDSDGTAITTIDLSAAVTYLINGHYIGVKVTSTESGDAFNVDGVVTES